MEKDNLFENDTGTIGQPYEKKKESESILAPYANIYSKWVIDLHIKLKSIRLLQENKILGPR